MPPRRNRAKVEQGGKSRDQEAAGIAEKVHCRYPEREKTLGEEFEDRSASDPVRRKSLGVYFTPPQLAELLTRESLAPLLQRLDNGQDASGEIERILQLRIVDPACGGGALLISAARFLMSRLVFLGLSVSEAGALLVERCLFGVDVDPSAIETTRIVLQRELGSDAGANLQTADALFDRPFEQIGSFDAVVGNPPFANAIERAWPPKYKLRLVEAYPEISGAADLSHYFWAMAHRWTSSAGVVGLILPRAALGAAPVAKLRDQFRQSRPPILLLAPPSPRYFPAANVFIALVVQHRSDENSAEQIQCRGGQLSPEQIDDARVLLIDGDNWWAPLSGAPASLDSDPDGPRLGDCFQVAASMTAGQAYALRPFVCEGDGGDNAGRLRLTTTGLIDPGVCKWGETMCRYLGQRYLRPSLRREGMPADLAKRHDNAKRPKVLVAGLSTRVEAFLDTAGTHCGAVSTYSVFHPNDDTAELLKLENRLNRKDASTELHRQLGAAALGGGRITIRKSFLQQLSWP